MYANRKNVIDIVKYNLELLNKQIKIMEETTPVAVEEVTAPVEVAPEVTEAPVEVVETEEVAPVEELVPAVTE